MQHAVGAGLVPPHGLRSSRDGTLAYGGKKFAGRFLGVGALDASPVRDETVCSPARQCRGRKKAAGCRGVRQDDTRPYPGFQLVQRSPCALCSFSISAPKPMRPSPYGSFRTCTTRAVHRVSSGFAPVTSLGIRMVASIGIPTCSGAEVAKKNPPFEMFSASVKCSVLSAASPMARKRSGVLKLYRVNCRRSGVTWFPLCIQGGCVGHSNKKVTLRIADPMRRTKCEFGPVVGQFGTSRRRPERSRRVCVIPTRKARSCAACGGRLPAAGRDLLLF